MSEATRFSSPRPTFRAPTNANAVEAMTPKPKDNTPAPSVVQRTIAGGNEALAKLLAESQAAAKASAKVIEANAKPRTPRKSSGESPTSEAPAHKEASPKFKPEDVVDDATFIRRTRGDIQSPEVQALFWANGGERHMTGGLTYAQALDNLRREKMQRIRNPQVPQTAYTRHMTLPQGKVITPGMPTEEDRVRQFQAQQNAKRIVTNERWAGIRK